MPTLVGVPRPFGGSHAPAQATARATWSLLATATLVAALATGVLTAIDARIGAVVLFGAIAVALALVRPTLVPPILVATIFFGEAVAWGPITPNRAAAPVALIAVLVQLRVAPPRIRDQRRTLAFVAAYGALAVASLAWTVSVSGTIYAVLSLAIALCYMAGFAALVRDTQQLRAVLWTVASCSAILGVWWVVSYLTGISRFENEAGDANFFAAYQVIALPLVLALGRSSRGPARAFSYVVGALIAVSIVSTLSRGGLLTLSVAVLALIALPSNALFRSRVQKAAFMSIGAVAVALILSIAWSDLADRFKVEHTRQGLWLAALNAYQQNPITGLGFGAFKEVSFELLRSTPGADLTEHTSEALREGRYVHNVYLASLAELGPLGVVCFVGILGATATSLLRTAKRARAEGHALVQGTANALTVGLVAFSVASMFLSSETSRGLWMIIGLSFALPQLLKSRSHASRELPV